MNQELKDLTFFELLKKASSKDYDQDDLSDGAQENPENFFDLQMEQGAVWRTNLFIQGEQERRAKTVLLCRVTSIEQNFDNTSIFKIHKER